VLGIALAESGLLPDAVVRFGIRRMLRQRQRELAADDAAAAARADAALSTALREGPIAALPELANRQHYEVDPAFFERVLGPHLKYSCAWWPPGVDDLGRAEEAMLALTRDRADVRDGMRVLDLGCGWGSFSLWLAERQPGSSVLAVSNSKPQREWILARARERGLANLEVVTADVNTFQPEGPFDRVVSIEMFEHVRNWEALLSRIAGWLVPDGKLFVHVFCHRSRAYVYEDRGPGDWMARTFFSGGLMPSEDLLPRCARELVLERRWRVNGLHYARTCEAWLRNLDGARAALRPALWRSYGGEDADLWRRRWRLFFLTCAELFGFRGGEEWLVAHHRLARRPETGA
jgi:cyclopropane-fatty-acyl-phospholipid synthase